MLDKIRVTIIVPCYNPFKGWTKCLIDRYNELQIALGDRYICSLVLVNDGTTGGIPNNNITTINNSVLNFTFINYSINRGKGYALRKGIASSDADIYTYTDIDFPYTTNSTAKSISAIANGSDVSVGKRSSEYYESVPLTRKILSKSLRYTMSFLFHTDISDSQAGIKSFNEKGKLVFLSTEIDRFLVDLEFILKAEKTLNINLVEVELRDNTRFTSFSTSTLLTEVRNLLKLMRKV